MKCYLYMYADFGITIINNILIYVPFSCVSMISAMRRVYRNIKWKKFKVKFKLMGQSDINKRKRWCCMMI